VSFNKTKHHLKNSKLLLSQKLKYMYTYKLIFLIL